MANHHNFNSSCKTGSFQVLLPKFHVFVGFAGMFCGYCQVLALEVVVIGFQIFGLAYHYKINSSCKTVSFQVLLSKFHV